MHHLTFCASVCCGIAGGGGVYTITNIIPWRAWTMKQETETNHDPPIHRTIYYYDVELSIFSQGEGKREPAGFSDPRASFFSLFSSDTW